MIRFGLTMAAALLAAGTALAQTQVERGRYLVETIGGCGNCHTPMGPQGPVREKHLGGGFEFKEQPFTAYAANITPDNETGIGRWTDQQIFTAIREGKRPDGSLIGPPMPFSVYRGLADDDVRAMVAYLRTVKPVSNKVAKSEYRMPLPPAWGPPVGEVKAPPQTDKVAYGAYLFGPVGHCTECHTPMTAPGQFDLTKIGAGGMPFHGPWGVSVAANLTSDKATGLGEWTDAQIDRAIRQGVSRDGRKLFPPMGFSYYAGIAPADMQALIAYIRTLPAVPTK